MIKYKRIVKTINFDVDIQEFFDDEITAQGWEIIYYNEKIMGVNTLKITVVCCKNNNIL